MNQSNDTAAAFWARDNAWFVECTITVRKVLTDNESCYLAHFCQGPRRR
jgi:hypothetical protein